MSWMRALYDTYDNLELQEKEGLLKIAHSTQKAHLEVQLSKEGKIINVSFLPVKDSDTVIPVTEESASRSSGAAPHPLFDKIKYLAGDYELYTGERNEEHHQKYMENLKKWCDSEYGDYKIEVLYKYLQENRLIHDLIERGIFSSILKIIGIGYLTEFANGICVDSGAKSIGDKLQFAGKVVILLLALPILENLIEIIAEILP